MIYRVGVLGCKGLGVYGVYRFIRFIVFRGLYSLSCFGV